MKKCPYCAERIQDAAIVCRYCGRDLPSEPLVTSKEIQGEISVWKQGAKASAVLTILYSIRTFLVSPSPTELVGSMTIGLVSTFVFWWLLCVAFVWVWRKLNGVITRVILVLVVLFALMFLAMLVYGGETLAYVSPTLTPVKHPTRKPTKTPSSLSWVWETPQPASCYSWDEIPDSLNGEYICIAGKVQYQRGIQDANNVYQYALIRFSESTYSFYVIEDIFVPDLENGQCVIVSGTLEYDANGIPFMTDATWKRC